MTFLPEAFIQSPLFGIALTIVVYVICEIIVDKFELSIIPPFVLACPMIIAFIYFQEPYSILLTRTTKQAQALSTFCSALPPWHWPCRCTTTDAL